MSRKIDNVGCTFDLLALVSEAAAVDEFRELELTQIEWVDPIRTEISEKDIEDMAKSILASSQIQPIVVEEISSGRYVGIVGRLRFLGCERAGKSTILARVHSFVGDSTRKAWQLIENLVRKDLNAVQKADGYQRFKECCEVELEAKKPGEVKKPLVKTMRVQMQEPSGDRVPAEKTIYEYLRVAQNIPDNVKKVLASLPGQNFGIKHALQLLRLKDDHDGMLKMANFIREEKPSKRQLKANVDDYLKIQRQATEPVKKAVNDEEISLRHGAIISEAYGDVQEPVLKMAKKGLKHAQVKKLVDFTRAHEERIPEILQKGANDLELAVSIAEGKSALETKEMKQAYFRSKKGKARQEEFQIPCQCPHCKAEFKKRLTVQWEHGELLFEKD